MTEIYDNGEICIGRVKDIIKYIYTNDTDLEEHTDLLQDLEELNDNDIVAVNYDNGPGYSLDWWTENDKIDIKESGE